MAGEPVEGQNNMAGASVRGQGEGHALPPGLWLNFEDGPTQLGGFPRRGRSLWGEAQAELSRKMIAGEVISGRRGVSPLTGDRKFESISLQGRVRCEPDFGRPGFAAPCRSQREKVRRRGAAVEHRHADPDQHRRHSRQLPPEPACTLHLGPSTVERPP
jgi:hypothetical protein